MAEPNVTTQLANLALAEVGEATPLLDLESSSTSVGKTVRSFYVQAWDETLRHAPWNFARRLAQLPALAAVPLFGFSAQFQLPSDYVAVQELPDLRRGDRWAVQEASPGVLAIACDLTAPLNCAYTYQNRNVDMADAAFRGAFVFCLASYIAVPITKDRTVRADCWAIFMKKIMLAKGADAREGSRIQMPDSAIVSGRD